MQEDGRVGQRMWLLDMRLRDMQQRRKCHASKRHATTLQMGAGMIAGCGLISAM
jgi:hypothetical protein